MFGFAIKIAGLEEAMKALPGKHYLMNSEYRISSRWNVHFWATLKITELMNTRLQIILRWEQRLLTLSLLLKRKCMIKTDFKQNNIPIKAMIAVMLNQLVVTVV